MSTDGSPSACPVFFAGTPKTSAEFDAFFANVEKIPTIKATQVSSLVQIVEVTKHLESGIVLLLFANKTDLVQIVNVLGSLKKRIDKGMIRTIVYSTGDHSKSRIPSLLKSKGCTEMLQDDLSQKTLVHKLQKHIQITEAKHRASKSQTKKIDEKEAAAKAAPGAGKMQDQAKPAERVAAKTAEQALQEKGKLKFVSALDVPADCWLVKSKRDFKYIRDNWIGEMIGPGPSAGAWIEEEGAATQPVYRWTPRIKTDNDPFVGNKGSWFCSGRRPEFDWKSNRWRFVGESPSLFFKATEGSSIAYRFRSLTVGTLDIALNSAPAKAKLNSMIATFSEEKVFKDEKKKPKSAQELLQEKEKKKKDAAYGNKLTKDEEAAAYGDKLTEDEEAAGAAYGDKLTEDEEAAIAYCDKLSEDEEAAALGDKRTTGADAEDLGELEEGEEGEEDAEYDWNDRQEEDESEEEADWSGLDIGRGNKFNSGRGMGQGDGSGDKGYKYDKAGKKLGADKDTGKETNDRTGEGEEEDPHDWSGLDVGRGNKFQSGGGLTQGQGGDKGYKYDEDDKPFEGKATEEDAEDDDLNDPFGLDVPFSRKKGAADSKNPDKRKKGAGGGDEGGDVDLDLDNLLGRPEDDAEWKSGASAFEKITLEITLKCPDNPRASPIVNVLLLERQGMDLLLDAPASGFKIGEKFNFSILLGQSGTRKTLTLAGVLKTIEPIEGSREIILVAVAEASKPQLTEIENVFDTRQEQLLKFLREAKG